MNARATARFSTAIVVTTLGLLLSVIFGLEQAAVLAAPWFILLVLGLGRPFPKAPDIASQVSAERVMVGDTVELTAEVTSSTPGLVTLQPRWHRPSRTGEQDRVRHSGPAVHAVRPGEATHVAFAIPFAEWGAWRLSSYSVKAVGPYGLYTGEAHLGAAAVVRVHPESIDLRRLVAPRFLRRATGRHRSRVAGRGIEFADIRPFTTGDQVRDINWLASARRGDLQVSDRHPERATDVVLLVDSLVEPGHDVERVLHLAVNAAIAAANGHLGLTDRVGLVEFGGVISWLPPATGTRQLHRLTDALLESVTFANSSDKVLPLLAPSIWPPRSLVLAMTPLLDRRFVAALFEARRRGHDVAVIEVDALDDIGAGSENEVQSLARRLVRAEQSVLRSELADHGIAVSVWHRGEPVENPLVALARLRRQVGVRR